MEEKLDRHELPIQTVAERGEACTVTVPLHLSVLSLPTSITLDKLRLGDARGVVRTWYDEDMDYHLYSLRHHQDSTSLVDGYERFQDTWNLDAVVDDSNFLALSVNLGTGPHFIRFSRAITHIYNQHADDGKFFSFEHTKRDVFTETMQRSRRHPDVVFMTPEKMRKYGVETSLAKIREDEGIAMVQAQALCSDYDSTSVVKSLVLRAFAVHYVNGLLEIAKSSQN